MLCNSTRPYKEGKYESGFPRSCDGKRKEKKRKIITDWKLNKRLGHGCRYVLLLPLPDCGGALLEVWHNSNLEERE